MSFLRRHRRVAVIFLLGAAGVWSACSLYDSSLLLPASATGDDGGTSDAATTDGAMPPAPAVDAGCQLFHAPPPPTTNDGTGNVDIVFAMTAFRLVPGGTASVNHPHAPVALDVDQRCTCPGPPSCTSPSSKTNCDTDGGGDDSAGDMWATFASLAPTEFNDDSLNAGLRLGYNGLLVRLRDYNGGKNDTQVSLLGYESPGTVPATIGKTPTVPKYDGTDVWTVDPASLLGGSTVDAGATCEGNDTACLPVVFDTNAYVSNGVVVGHLSIPVTAGGTNTKLRVALSDVIVVAPLVYDGTSYRVDEGQFSGRWELSHFLESLQSVPDPVDGTQGLCGTSASYANVKKIACDKRDVMSGQAMDNTNATCDALSITVSLSAVQAHLGPIFQPNPIAERCGAGYTDSCP